MEKYNVNIHGVEKGKEFEIFCKGMFLFDINNCVKVTKPENKEILVKEAEVPLLNYINENSSDIMISQYSNKSIVHDCLDKVLKTATKDMSYLLEYPQVDSIIRDKYVEVTSTYKIITRDKITRDKTPNPDNFEGYCIESKFYNGLPSLISQEELIKNPEKIGKHMWGKIINDLEPNYFSFKALSSPKRGVKYQVYLLPKINEKIIEMSKVKKFFNYFRKENIVKNETMQKIEIKK